MAWSRGTLGCNLLQDQPRGRGRVVVLIVLLHAIVVTLFSFSNLKTELAKLMEGKKLVASQ
jgi:hypothetical protein